MNLTCRDGELHFPGHINFERNFGYAVTHSGCVDWEAYSGPLAALGDWDFAFALRNDGGTLTPGSHGVVKIEIDSREMRFVNGWWAKMKREAIFGGADVDAAHFGGKKRSLPGIVTGLLGIDAEHGHVELHPAYAMALRTDVSEGELSEPWSLFVRDRGNEGMCSKWRRPHILPLPPSPVAGMRSYALRIPWSAGAASVELRKGLFLCATGAADVKVTYKKDIGLRLSFKLEPASMIHGDVKLSWRDADGNPISSQRRACSAIATEQELFDFEKQAVEDARENIIGNYEWKKTLNRVLPAEKHCGAQHIVPIPMAVEDPHMEDLTKLDICQGPHPPRRWTATFDETAAQQFADKEREKPPLPFEKSPEEILCERDTGADAKVREFCTALRWQGLHNRETYEAGRRESSEQ